MFGALLVSENPSDTALKCLYLASFFISLFFCVISVCQDLCRKVKVKDVQHRCESWLLQNLDWCAAAAAAKSLQLCPTLCDPRDGSPPGSPVPGILQARTLEWVAISFSNACKWKVKVKSLSRLRLLATPWTAAYQAPPSMGFSRQEYWSGVPLSKSPNHKIHIKLQL